MNDRQNNNSANMLNNTDRPFNTQQPFVRIESVMDGISPNPLADNSTTESSIIFISGTTLPNETVFVFLNDGRQRIVRADGEGNWSATVTSWGSYGEAAIKVTLPLANVSDDFNLTLVEPAPETRPAIDKIIDDSHGWMDLIAPGSTTENATPLVSGFAPAGSLVIITVNGEPVGSVIADSDNRWEWSTPLQEGLNTIKVSTNGEESEPLELTYAPFVAPIEPELAILQINDSMGSEVQPGGAANSNDVMLRGTGPRYQILEIWAGDRFVGNAWTDENGNWQQYVTLPEGENSLSVSAGGMQSEVVAIITPVAPPPTPEIFSAWADENNLGPVFNGGMTSDATPRLEGRAGSHAVVEIWNNRRPVGSVIADQNGYWNYTPTLAEGRNQFVVISQGVSSSSFTMTYAPVVGPVEQELSITQISDTLTGTDIAPGGSAI
ncbi:hypothetical protein HX773_19745, partial [Pantoea sp. B9002]|uniref:hypothetical protein n=1 Tax=Pantoea sp. B9002 TaxID=2726979 RepID=UPI0015A478A7